MVAPILPRSKPQKHKMRMMRLCLRKQKIKQGKIKFSFLRFYLLPIDGNFQSIEMHEFCALPNRRKKRRPCARIMNLAAKNKKWLPINQKRIPSIFRNNLRFLCFIVSNKKQEKNEQTRYFFSHSN